MREIEFSEKIGLVVACSDKYAPILYPSLRHLRNNLNSRLACEIWHAGNELSEKVKRQFKTIPGVVIKDLLDYAPPPASLYWGWQIKPLIIKLSSFEEAILMDADIFFFEKPEVLLNHPGYKKTGAFFFRDRRLFLRPREASFIENFGKWADPAFYEEQKKFMRKIILAPSSYLPKEWGFFWREESPSKESPFLVHWQESGCVVFDKKRHKEGLRHILELNKNHKEVYQFVYGDKETYWMGLEMAKEPYYVNKDFPVSLMNRKGGIKTDILQHVDGSLFYQQKKTPHLEKKDCFFEMFEGKKGLSLEEKEKIETIYCAQRLYKIRVPFWKKLFGTLKKLWDALKQLLFSSTRKKSSLD
jgi:hypothetical protein